MSRQLPFLALDSVGKRTILNDYSLPMSGGKVTTKKEKTMSRIMSNQEVQSHARKLVARLLGQDAANDETVEKLKWFLKSRLSAEDHEQVCNMLAGGDVDAEDDLPENAAGGPLPKKASLAGDSAGFAARFPGLAHIKIDNSGLPIPKRASHSADADDFYRRYPDARRIKQA